jgi:hypothetical protein
VPSAELRRQISPGTSGAPNPKHRFDEPTIIGSRSATIAFLSRQNMFDPVPYFVIQQRSEHLVWLA